MAAGIIYHIINLVNGWIYVGSTLNEKQRLGRHMRHLKKKKHVNKALQRDYDEFGEDCFEVLVVHRDVPERDLHAFESSEIAVLQEETGRVYNISRTPRISAARRKQLADQRMQKLFHERKDTWSPTLYSPARTKSGKLPQIFSTGSIEPTTSQLMLALPPRMPS